MRLFLNRFRQSELDFGERESERNAGETRSGAGVKHVFRALEQAPGNDGIEDVFDGRFARTGDAGEVEMPVGFDDQGEVSGRFEDYVIAVGEIGGQDVV